MKLSKKSTLFAVMHAAFGLVACGSPPNRPKQSVNYSSPHISENIAYVVGVYTSGKCNAYCSQNLSTSLPDSFDQAEIFLTGWRAENVSMVTTLRKIMLSARSFSYDPVSGSFDWEAAAEILSTSDAQEDYYFTLFFTIVLTKNAGARLAIAKNVCTGLAGRCKGNIVIPNVVPSGWDFLALGVRAFELEVPITSSTGISINRLSIDMSEWMTQGTDLVSNVFGAIHDATPKEAMTCNVEAIGIVAAPGETFQQRFSNDHDASSFFGLSHMVKPPGLPVDGGFGGLEAFELRFLNYQESKTWAWAADYVDILICPNMIDFCYHEIGFLGDQFGATTNFLDFNLKNKGFAIWTRP